MRGVGGGRAQGTREERRGGRPKTLSPHSRSLHLKATGSIIGQTKCKIYKEEVSIQYLKEKIMLPEYFIISKASLGEIVIIKRGKVMICKLKNLHFILFLFRLLFR